MADETSDFFAVFGETRRPWLDEERLKAKFHRLTAEHHPDVAAETSPDFSALNVAYNALREPRTRLRLLLQLEAPEFIARHLPAPPAIGDLFAQMGAKKQTLDTFLKRRATASSALAKAMLMPEQFALQEELEEWLRVLEAETEHWNSQIPALDEAWTAGQREVTPQIAETMQALGYLDKWSAQIREGLVKLQLG